MVGVKCGSFTPTLIQHHRRIRRRCAHRRTVDGAGQCAGSGQCGAACSAVAPAPMCSQACRRQCKVKGAEGASQSGKIVKVFPHGSQIPRASPKCLRAGHHGSDAVAARGQ